jgi:GDP-mannose 4,6-dehydratase
MSNKVLITGITGMVGSHMADFLLKKTKSDIVGICRWRSPLDNVDHLLQRANQKNRLKFEYADLNDLSSLIKVIKKEKPSHIYHLAAQSFPNVSFSEPINTLSTNILGTYNLLDAIKILNLSPKIHICSSSEIFGRVPKEQVPIREDNRFHPASPYAISKVGTDLIGKFFADAYSMKIFITRMFTHTGPRRGDVFAESSFAKQIAMIEQKKQKPVIYVGNLDSMRTFADVRDAVRAYYVLLNSNQKKGECFNIGGNFSCTIKEMLKFLVGKSKYKKVIKIKIDPKRVRPIDADLQIPDTSKFQKATGWKPQIKFEKTMVDLLNYWRNKVKASNFLIR